MLPDSAPFSSATAAVCGEIVREIPRNRTEDHGAERRRVNGRRGQLCVNVNGGPSASGHDGGLNVVADHIIYTFVGDLLVVV